MWLARLMCGLLLFRSGWAEAQSAPLKFSTRVIGDRPQAERAVSDFSVRPDALRAVPRQSAGDLLTLAPGILLTNHGGEGHAQRVFLRGFDAREGQDLEFSVGGVPLNEVANAHGQGYADTYPVLPEVVSSLRVIEGPFDPHQGDFAVAGSAAFLLGVADRGLRVAYRTGSFASHRLLLLYAPTGDLPRGLSDPATFGAVALEQSDGFGANRFSQRATAIAQVALDVSEHTQLRWLAMSYATRFQSPGILRNDDFRSGRVDFFDTYDTRQGGDAQRHSLSLELRANPTGMVLSQQVFVTLRELRIRENFTGYLLDPQLQSQASRGESPQRGDLLDQHTQELTLGARGSLRLTRTLFGAAQHVELGYFARHDRNDASQERLRSPANSGTLLTPYRTDFAFQAGESNLAAYLDTELHITRYVTLRGGVRADFFLFDLLDRCVERNVQLPAAPLDVDCYGLDRYGPRLMSERRSATGFAIQPRVSLQVQPLPGLSLSGSYGQGARSADPLYLGDGDNAPFASIRATEAGAVFQRRLAGLALTTRGAFFYTHVDRDLIFNQTVGRNTLANGTTRLGLFGAAALSGSFLEAQVHVTWARATFDDSSLLVPYVPQLVLRGDLSTFGELPRLRLWSSGIRATLGLGFTYVAPRPLPFSERGDPYALLDLALHLRWRFADVGFEINNLLNSRYRQSEFNYVSDFQSRAYPTRVPERHFVAGPPLGLFVTLTLYLDQVLTAVSPDRPASGSNAR